jgi:hypothetical protein
VETRDQEIFVPRRGNDPTVADNGELAMTGSQAQDMSAPRRLGDHWPRGRPSHNAGRNSAAANQCRAHRGSRSNLTSAVYLAASQRAGRTRQSAPRMANTIANTNDDIDTISANRRNKEARA